MSQKRRSGKSRKEQQKILEHKILEVLSLNPKRPLNYKQIARKLDLQKNNEKKWSIEILIKLASREKLVEVAPGKFKLNGATGGYIIGIMVRERGTAWVTPESGEEQIMISERFTNKALDGDRVKVLLHAKRHGHPPEGEISSIIDRTDAKFVGVVEMHRGNAFFICDSRKLGTDIFIPLEELNGAKDRQKVVVEITDWPKRAKNPFGKVIEVLGDVGENNTEIHAILAEYGLPTSYPLDLEKEASHIAPGIEGEVGKRRDMRDITTFTIDPANAKDFDDAISLQKVDDDMWEVGVHIADVTHYVTPDSFIDEEGASRATSVYLVDRVVPMLPEHLSNFICSLRPNEDKLTFSVVFRMNSKAEVKDSWIGRTITHSDRRFTYEEAQEIIDTKEGDYCDELITLNSMSKKLTQKRFAAGAINFERMEVKFNLDENGKPLGVKFKESIETNRLIEELMLLANRTVAEFIGKEAKGKQVKPFVYRIHNAPDPDKFDQLKSFVKRFGYELASGKNNTVSASINDMLGKVKGSNEQNLIETIAIRTMSKAIYSTQNVGHYGLSFGHYSHFTSPIRRYPDMMVHRLLQHYLDGGKAADEEALEKQCKHCSDMEVLATKAERSSIKYKQVEFMADKVGKKFDGIITGVANFGFFVEISENGCEGLVPMRDLQDDYYFYDEENFSLKGRRFGTEYRLGDKVTIEVARANVEKKQLDFILG